MLFCTFGQFADTVHVKIPKTFHTERPFAASALLQRRNPLYR